MFNTNIFVIRRDTLNLQITPCKRETWKINIDIYAR